MKRKKVVVFVTLSLLLATFILMGATVRPGAFQLDLD